MTDPVPTPSVPIEQDVSIAPVRVGSVSILEGDNLAAVRALPDASFTLVYLDPPFNTGRARERQIVTDADAHNSGRIGCRGANRPGIG